MRRPPRKRTTGAAGRSKPASTPSRTTAARPTRRRPTTTELALAAFAHEVRTPLTGILAISDLLATSELGPRERRWAETIKAGAEHLASLATLFVDAARSGLPDAALRAEPFDLRGLARSLGDSLAGRTTAKGLSASVTLAPDLPAIVIGDAVRLRAAVENLLDNAVKFTAEGEVSLDVRARRVKGGWRVVFAVTDSGIGLSQDEIDRLFRPFSQANAAIAARFGGAGLGLSSVRQLALAMGGDVKVGRRRGGGAVFNLEVVMAEAAPVAETDAGQQVLSAPGSLRILSVEDNPFGRVVLNTILTELGHQVEFVGLGKTAVTRLGEHAFDVVLMDMVLPDLSGVAAIRRIRRQGGRARHIPVVGVSGRTEDEAAAREAGADAFLVKPVSPRQLASALAEVMRPARAI